MKAHLCIPLLEENQGEKNTQMMTKLSSKSDSLVEFSMRIQRIKPTTYNKFLVTFLDEMSLAAVQLVYLRLIFKQA